MSQSSEGQSSDGQSSDGQSSGGGRQKGLLKNIPCKLHGIAKASDANVGLARITLEMPSDLKKSGFNKDTYHVVLLDVKDDDQMETLKIMKTLPHPNILGIYFVNEVQGEGVRVYVERYSGVLSDLLKKSLVNPKTYLIPSVAFQDTVSEIIDGLNHLRENGEYHGNFAFCTTFYSNDSSKSTVKLANFERKRSKSLVECQVADCVSLGYALAEISKYEKQRHPISTAFCLIDDISSRLTSVATNSLDTVMGGIKDHVFFWDERRRKTFFSIEVPAAWDCKAVEDSFIHSKSMPAKPWTDNRYDGYLHAMQVYRREHGIDAYNGDSWKDFLRCISGMYTHQTELYGVSYISVDSSVLSAHPRLCLDLKAAMDQAASLTRKN